MVERFWGDGETLYSQTAPNVFTDNELHGAMRAVSLVTSAYVGAGACGCTTPPCQALGCPRLQSTDVWDRNTYSGFVATLHAGDTQHASIDFAAWKAATAAAGHPFDTSSTEIPPPTGTWVRLIKNAYAPGRARLVIVNHGADSAATAAVDLATLAAPGDVYTIHALRDPYGAPLASGMYNGEPIVVAAPAEIQVFVVRVATAACSAD